MICISKRNFVTSRAETRVLSVEEAMARFMTVKRVVQIRSVLAGLVSQKESRAERLACTSFSAPVSADVT